MNTGTQDRSKSSNAQMPFHSGNLGADFDFIMQSGEYLGLNISYEDAAAILAKKDIDASAYQQINRQQ
jgi:hypothetical protein